MSGGRRLSEKIRALVVEDSGFMSRVIRRILASDPQIDVVGQATDGVEAVAAVAALRPDVVTMDVHMPRSDGLAAVARIMAEHPTPILMVSSHTREGSAAAIRALELGAVDFVTKPAGPIDLDLESLREELIRKVKMAARVRPVRTTVVGVVAAARHSAGPAGRAAGRRLSTERRPGGPRWTPCVVLAASTGGPAALLSLVPGLPGDLEASIIIVQHMPAPYTAQLARELARRAPVRVKEAESGEALERGTAYVTPGDRILTVSADGCIALETASRAAAGADSANRTMISVAEHAGPAAVAVILTGMGADGAAGAAAIKRAGGVVLAQDEASCLVYGMPRAAVEAGFVDAVVPLDRLPQAMVGSLAGTGGA